MVSRRVAVPAASTAAGRVLIDSGPLLALFNRADHWHTPVQQWLQAHPDVRLISTWPVATEVCALLARRIGNPAALDFLRWLQRGAVQLDGPADGSLADVLAISERFADLPFDLADASIAEAASRLKLRQVLSIDADFDVYRDRSGRPLVNLLRA
jgi:predicted nucleic acid-binding protein